jgi:hypothetical protein
VLNFFRSFCFPDLERSATEKIASHRHLRNDAFLHGTHSSGDLGDRLTAGFVFVLVLKDEIPTFSPTF